jgi:metal-responsive CopG/Arc/MetJ family transcriptional regulator
VSLPATTLVKLDRLVEIAAMGCANRSDLIARMTEDAWSAFVDEPPRAARDPAYD